MTSLRCDCLTTILNFCQERRSQARALNFVLLDGVVQLSFGEHVEGDIDFRRSFSLLMQLRCFP
jgi:hypothetical protein